MANTKSAIKNIRKIERRRAHNKVFRTRARTLIKKTNSLIEVGDMEAAQEAAQLAAQALDKAAKRRVIHPNNAARRKARLMRRLNQALQSSSTE